MDPRSRRRSLGRRRCPDLVFEVMAADDRLVAALPGALPCPLLASCAGYQVGATAGADYGTGYPGDHPRPRWRRAAGTGAGAICAQGRDWRRAGAPSLGCELVAALLRQG